MAELRGDCPRCGIKHTTFDLLAEVEVGTRYDWQTIWEAFCVCRSCLRGTVFRVILKEYSAREVVWERRVGGL